MEVSGPSDKPMHCHSSKTGRGKNASWCVKCGALITKRRKRYSGHKTKLFSKKYQQKPTKTLCRTCESLTQTFPHVHKPSTASTPKHENQITSPLNVTEPVPDPLIMPNCAGGFMNLGNTCYIGASLQVLLHSNIFLQWLEMDSLHRYNCCGDCVICALWNVNTTHKMGQPIDIELFVDTVKDFIPYVADCKQHDAHEFMTDLLQAIDKQFLLRFGAMSTTHSVDALASTPTSTIFGFLFQEESQCALGHSSRTNKNVGTQLQLPVMKTVMESITMFFSKEQVIANCLECRKENVPKLKEFRMVPLPKQLILQLNRFSAGGAKNNTRTKIQHIIHVGGKPFRLSSLILHEGEDPHEGHYTSLCSWLSNGKTVRTVFDDSQVKTVPPTTLNSGKCESSVYMLCYQLMSSSDMDLFTSLNPTKTSLSAVQSAFPLSDVIDDSSTTIQTGIDTNSTKIQSEQCPSHQNTSRVRMQSSGINSSTFTSHSKTIRARVVNVTVTNNGVINDRYRYL